MEIGLGHLRLSPDAFWRMSIVEYEAAQRGYMQSRGTDPDKQPVVMTKDKLAELMRRFPDGQ